MMKPSVSDLPVIIIGFGNLGQHLAKGFKEHRVDVKQILSRSVSSGDFQFIKSPGDIYSEEAICLLTVPDSRIEEIGNLKMLQNKLVVHCSGSVAMEKIGAKRKGVFYPVQSFSPGAKITWSEVPLCLEAAQESDLVILQNLASKLSSRVVEMNSLQRLHLHLAAVIASNFTTHLLELSHNYLKKEGIQTDLLDTLIKNSVDKALNLGPQLALTGPAKRGDNKVIEKHLEMLNDQPLLKKIYNLLSESIRHNHERQS